MSETSIQHYSIYRDETLTDQQGYALDQLSVAVSKQARSLVSLATQARADLDSLRKAERPFGISAQSLREVGENEALVQTWQTAAHLLGVDLGKIATVVRQASGA